jgi:hypothetical protein
MYISKIQTHRRNKMFDSKEIKDMNKYIPEVKFNKNGYEIRTQMLEMAQTQLWNDYQAKWGQFEMTVKKDGDQVVTTIEAPAIPGADQILKTAEMFYNFVNMKK